MNFRLITLAGCVALGSIGLAGKADAQATATTAAITTAVTVSACTITPGTAPVLARTPGGLNAVEAGKGIFGLGVTGTAGTMTVTCANGGSLTVAPPTGSAPPGFNPTVRQTVAQLVDSSSFTSASVGGNFDGGAWNRPTTPMIIPSAAAGQTVNVGMIIGTNAVGSPPSGNYAYTSALTVTGN